jgi:hypothetical protein
MKYFAKYFPIEGEIKEGDIGVMLLKNNIPTPHKLFLCSRDIHIGDEIWYYGLLGDLKQGKFYHLTKGYEGENIVDLTPEGEGTGFDLGSDGFKVIGEISPEATFVKEGEEFEGWGIDLDYSGDFEKPKLIFIKCKCCNTFK